MDLPTSHDVCQQNHSSINSMVNKQNDLATCHNIIQNISKYYKIHILPVEHPLVEAVSLIWSAKLEVGRVPAASSLVASPVVAAASLRAGMLVAAASLPDALLLGAFVWLQRLVQLSPGWKIWMSTSSTHSSPASVTVRDSDEHLASPWLNMLLIKIFHLNKKECVLSHLYNYLNLTCCFIGQKMSRRYRNEDLQCLPQLCGKSSLEPGKHGKKCTKMLQIQRHYWDVFSDYCPWHSDTMWYTSVHLNTSWRLQLHARYPRSPTLRPNMVPVSHVQPAAMPQEHWLVHRAPGRDFMTNRQDHVP